MKRENLDRVKKVCDKLDSLEKRIKYLQGRKENESNFIRIEGKESGGNRFCFDVELGPMKGYIIAQIIQRFQAEKAALEKELKGL